jgi:hypothetical protein
MEPMFHCKTCDEAVHDYADITIHKARSPGSHEIIEA